MKITRAQLKEHIRTEVRKALSEQFRTPGAPRDTWSDDVVKDLTSKLHDYQYQLKKSDPSDVDARMELRDKIEGVQEELRVHMMYYNN